MNYTKGPWKLHNNKPWIVTSKHKAICEMKNRECEDNEANASLISAAPDMYEALKTACLVIENLARELDRWEQIETSFDHSKILSAIFQVEGRTEE